MPWTNWSATSSRRTAVSVSARGARAAGCAAGANSAARGRRPSRRRLRSRGNSFGRGRSAREHKPVAAAHDGRPRPLAGAQVVQPERHLAPVRRALQVRHRPAGRADAVFPAVFRERRVVVRRERVRPRAASGGRTGGTARTAHSGETSIAPCRSPRPQSSSCNAAVNAAGRFTGSSDSRRSDARNWGMHRPELTTPPPHARSPRRCAEGTPASAGRAGRSTRSAAAAGSSVSGGRAAGPFQRQVLGGVGVHREVVRPPADLRRDGVDQRVLHPHAGVVQLGLVPRRDQRAGVVGMAEVLRATGDGSRAGATFCIADGIGRAEPRGLSSVSREQLGRLGPDEQFPVARPVPSSRRNAEWASSPLRRGIGRGGVSVGRCVHEMLAAAHALFPTKTRTRLRRWTSGAAGGRLGCDRCGAIRRSAAARRPHPLVPLRPLEPLA